MKNKAIKLSKIFTVIFAISCVLLSSVLIADVWGKYFSQSSGGSTGNIAKFEVSAEFTGEFTGEQLTFTLEQTTPSANYTFSVISESEVPLSYDLVLTLPSALPSGVSFMIDEVAPTTDTNSLVYTFSNVGTFTASGGTNSHTLVITSTNFSNAVALDGITVTIIAMQI